MDYDDLDSPVLPQRELDLGRRFRSISSSFAHDSAFHCYEFLSLLRLEGTKAMRELLAEDDEDDGSDGGDVNREMRRRRRRAEREWYLALFMQRSRERLRAFLDLEDEEEEEEEEEFLRPLSPSSPVVFRKTNPDRQEMLTRYLSAHNFTELHLDSVFQGRRGHTNWEESHGGPKEVLPGCLFRCCPNTVLLSLRNNYLDYIPPDIGRLKRLAKLYLTNNRLQNRSVPFTLTFCSSLRELYLDHNLLDALPGFLLRMRGLRVVHRHGNHNYFKATFMWYHTDVNNRVMEDQGAQLEDEDEEELPPPFPAGTLQEAAARAVLASRMDFYEASSVLPLSVQDRLSRACRRANLCGNCRTARDASRPGFKVFTFKNPYLGNTCVPFLHWSCSRECAEAIEVPARREQVLSAAEQDRLYQRCVRRTLASLRPSQRSISSLAPSSSSSSSSSSPSSSPDRGAADSAPEMGGGNAQGVGDRGASRRKRKSKRSRSRSGRRSSSQRGRGGTTASSPATPSPRRPTAAASASASASTPLNNHRWNNHCAVI